MDNDKDKIDNKYRDENVDRGDDFGYHVDGKDQDNKDGVNDVDG